MQCQCVYCCKLIEKSLKQKHPSFQGQTVSQNKIRQWYVCKVWGWRVHINCLAKSHEIAPACIVNDCERWRGLDRYVARGYLATGAKYTVAKKQPPYCPSGAVYTCCSSIRVHALDEIACAHKNLFISDGRSCMYFWCKSHRHCVETTWIWLVLFVIVFKRQSMCA